MYVTLKTSNRGSLASSILNVVIYNSINYHGDRETATPKHTQCPYIRKGELSYTMGCQSADDPPDISGLPSLDHALYLSETVKFHLGQSYRLYNEDEFIHNVREFYYGDS